MNKLVSSDTQITTLAIRLLNATLFVALLASVFFLITKPLKQAFLFSVALTVVPLGLFLIPSVNPSSWVITGVFASFFAQLGAGMRSGWRKYALLGLAILGLALAAGSRYDGLFYGLVAIVIATILSGVNFSRLRRLSSIVWLAVVAFIILIQVTLMSTAPVTVSQKFAELFDGDSDFFPTLLKNLAQLPLFVTGFHGSMGLGWLDTGMPYSTWMVASFLFWAAIFARLKFMPRRQLVLVMMLTTLVLLLPLAALQWTGSEVGESIQARYFYPLIIVLVATALLNKKSEKISFSMPQLLVAALGLFVAQALAIFTNMLRYISGTGGDDLTWNLNRAAESGWWWDSGPDPMTVLWVAVLSFGVFLALAIFEPRVKRVQYSKTDWSVLPEVSI